MISRNSISHIIIFSCSRTMVGGGILIQSWFSLCFTSVFWALLVAFISVISYLSLTQDDNSMGQIIFGLIWNVVSPKKTYRWLTNTWRDAQHHSLSEKCKSKPQWGTITCHSGWLLSKSVQAINAGEGVKIRKTSYTFGGNVN